MLTKLRKEYTLKVMNNMPLNAPVLLIAFNRPDTIKIVFQKIREARPAKFYIALDGPRENKIEDKILIEDVKKIVENIDWPCEKHFKYNQINKGAEFTVSSAISWVLEKEEFVIILEDDILVPISFFTFVQEMLIKYRHVTNIWAVSGCNFTPIPLKDNYDYFFSKYGHPPGWGTWKRAWQYFDLSAQVQKKHLSKSFLKTITNSSSEARYFRNKFKRINKNGINNNTWDTIASYMHRSNNWLYIIPRVNLISNIGTDGLHARGKTKYHYTEFDSNFIAKNHPVSIHCNIEYDKHHFKTYINKKKPLFIRIIIKIRSLLSK